MSRVDKKHENNIEGTIYHSGYVALPLSLTIVKYHLNYTYTHELLEIW
jgi:hypothetical protein